LRLSDQFHPDAAERDKLEYESRLEEMIRRTTQLIRRSQETVKSTQDLIAQCRQRKKAEKRPAHKISGRVRDRAA
jgi:hypothetical protein